MALVCMLAVAKNYMLGAAMLPVDEKAVPTCSDEPVHASVRMLAFASKHTPYR